MGTVGEDNFKIIARGDTFSLPKQQILVSPADDKRECCFEQRNLVNSKRGRFPFCIGIVDSCTWQIGYETVIIFSDLMVAWDFLFYDRRTFHNNIKEI